MLFEALIQHTIDWFPDFIISDLYTSVSKRSWEVGHGVNVVGENAKPNV